MSEFEGGNQTAPETIESNEPVNTQPEPPAQEPPSPPQENVFTVKYNKEEIQVPYEQAPDYIQKGLNYDKVSQRATEYEQQINRAAQLMGYQTHDEFLQAMEHFEKEQEQKRYEEAGIDQNTFNQLLDQHPDIQYAREMKAKQEKEAKFQQEANEFFEAFPDVKAEDVQPEVFQLQKQKGLSMLDAFLRVNYKNLAQQQEQAAIQKLQQNQQSTPGALGQEGAEHASTYGQLSAQDKKALRERVLRGENVQF